VTDFALLIGPFTLAISLGVAIAILLVSALLLAFAEGRKTSRKLFCLSRNMFFNDIGLRGFGRLFLFSVFGALTVALARGLVRQDLIGTCSQRY
jgi:hypothetical protein